jgi:uncharacterized membrane protein (DUF4010 family)
MSDAMGELTDLSLDPELLAFFKNLLITVGIGLLLGLEREFSKGRDEGDPSFAGVRTFPIVALIGFLAATYADLYSPWVYVAALLGTFAFTVFSYQQGAKRESYGGTSEFSLIIAFLLGGLVVKENYHGAVSIAVIVTALLALKVRLHALIDKLDKGEVFSILIMVVITALVMPLLPNENAGPFETLNPYKAWLIVVIFVSLNFLAYFTEKFIGSKRSVLITGIIGGFASSTATAWYFSRKTSGSEKGGVVEASSILLASSIMFPRLLIWLFILDQELLRMLWLPVTLFGLLGVGIGYWMSRQSREDEVEASPRQASNPINFKEAFIFAGIYIVIQLLVGYANAYFGDRGVYIASVIAGLTDIDAITISMADYQEKSIKMGVAGAAIILAAFSNTLIKYAFCLIFGNQTLRRYSTIGFVGLFLAGIGYGVFRFLV